MICNRCRNNIPDDSEFCQYCGQKIKVIIMEKVETQTEWMGKYKKLMNDTDVIKRKRNTAIIILSILLAVSIIAILLLSNSISDLKEANNDKIFLMNEWIVFIENDGTDLYHRYECDRFVGNDCWAHNVEYAEYIGKSPCPLCID